MRFVLASIVVAGCGVEPLDVEESDPDALEFGGGGCHPGDWGYPLCAEGGPTLPPPNCDGLEGCYNLCQWIHTCDPWTWGGCDELSDCLDNCDAQFPGCY